MFKSLQTKVVAITMAVILASYLILSGMFLFFAQRYAFGQRRQSMEDAINSANNVMNLQLSIGTQVLLDSVAMTYSSDIIITDQGGAIRYCSSPKLITAKKSASGIVMTSNVPSSVMEQLSKSGTYSGIGTLSGTLTGTRLIIGAPAVNGDGSNFGYYIFATSNANSYSGLFLYLSRLLLASVLITLAITFVATNLSTIQLVRPLRDMNNAAKEYAKGNFETRMGIRGKDEITQLAVSLNNMADSLGRMEQMRRSFISSVSHDLRTPMTTISGFVDGILDGTIPPESEKYYLSLVSEETKRLSRLVRTLLDVSRLESGGDDLKLGDYDICEMLRQVVVSFESKILAKDLKLRFELCDESVHVRADNDAIFRVIYNLVDNAIKFSYDVGMLSLSVWKNGKEAIISVRNTGYGIKKDDLPFVFDRFFKTDKSRGLDKSGVGLGLYIAKTIVEKHGGNIAVHSVENEFCEFTFTLPLA